VKCDISHRCVFIIGYAVLRLAKKMVANETILHRRLTESAKHAEDKKLIKSHCLWKEILSQQRIRH